MENELLCTHHQLNSYWEEYNFIDTPTQLIPFPCIWYV